MKLKRDFLIIEKFLAYILMLLQRFVGTTNLYHAF